MPADNHVTRLMNDAITAAAHPGLILVRVCEMLRPKSGKKLPAGRKLSDEQAAAAAMVVTRIVERLGVSLAAVCRMANVAPDPNNYYRFLLTREERGAGATTFAKGRFNKTISRYRDLVVAAATLSKSDQIPLLDELAGAVHDFLEPFVPLAQRDEFEELLEGLGEIGRYLSKPRKSPDGTMVDLDRLWTACRERRLEFDHTTSALEYAGEDPESTWHLTWPRIFLFPRIVGRVQVECSVNDGSDILDHTLESLKNRSRPIGRVAAELCYAVHLAIAPARTRGKAKPVLLLEPWTALPLGPRSKRQDRWGSPKIDVWCPGFPFTTTRGEDEQGTFDVLAAGAAEPKCPEFRDWLERIDLGDPRTDETFRAVEITPEILELMLRHESSPPAWDFLGRWANRSALPPSAEMPGGVPSEESLDRFRDALHRNDEKALDHQLLMSAVPMAKALDEFLETSGDEMTRRKAAFMRRMRS